MMPEIPKIVLADPNLVPVYDLTDCLGMNVQTFHDWHEEHAKDIKVGSKIMVDGQIRQVDQLNGKVWFFSSKYGRDYSKEEITWLEENWRKRRVRAGCDRSYCGLFDYQKISEKAIGELNGFANSRLFRSEHVVICKAIHAFLRAWKQIQTERANFGRFVRDFLEQRGYELNDSITWDGIIDAELRNLDKLLVWKRSLMDHSDTNFRMVCRKIAAKRNAWRFSKTGSLQF
jgi:hypothetical protein